MAKKVNYFTFNGENYYVGTIVAFKSWIDGKIYYAKYTGERDVFVEVKQRLNGCYTPDVRPYKYCLGESHIVEIIHPVPKNKVRSVKYKKDTESNDMFYAWVYYILFMFFISFTVWAVYGWIFGSYYFWRYRHDKLYKDVECD